jgi:hypothetical protein
MSWSAFPLAFDTGQLSSITPKRLMSRQLRNRRHDEHGGSQRHLVTNYEYAKLSVTVIAMLKPYRDFEEAACLAYEPFSSNTVNAPRSTSS